MSIQKEYGYYTPTCDFCGKELDREDDFYAAVAARKKADWLSRLNGNEEWEDLCVECQESEHD